MAEGKPVDKERAAVERIKRQPRIFMNGFPKSGLHLAILMARGIAKDPSFEPPWCGSFTHNAWSTQWRSLEQIMTGLNRISDGTFLKGHMGYMPIVEQYLYWHGVSAVFIYRDLRDVLVSQSYHVIAEDDTRFYHTGKDVYREMDKEERLLACLHGVGPYAGLFERWCLYAPWLSIPWVYRVRFEDMVHDRERIAREFYAYVWNRTAAGLTEIRADSEGLDNDHVKAIIHNLTLKKVSPTFRKGKTGGWREEFTPRVKDEFKEKGGAQWLIRLGYEEDDQW